MNDIMEQMNAVEENVLENATEETENQMAVVVEEAKEQKIRGPERAFVSKEGNEKKKAIADALIKGIENMSRFHKLQLIELGYVAQEAPAEATEKRGRGRPAYQYVATKKGKSLMGWRNGIGKDKTE